MGFFNPDNWLWRGFGRIADYFMLSAFWLLSCIPLVTAGSACIALYDTVARCIRGTEENMLRRYWSTFKKELLRGILLTVLWAAVSLVLGVVYQEIVRMGAELFSVVYFVLLLLPLGMMCWLVALESRFTYRFGELHRMALYFTIGHLPQTLVIVALLVAVLNVALNFPFFLIFLPAILAHLQSFFIEKTFAKHMPAEESEV